MCVSAHWLVSIPCLYFPDSGKLCCSGHWPLISNHNCACAKLIICVWHSNRTDVNPVVPLCYYVTVGLSPVMATEPQRSWLRAKSLWCLSTSHKLERRICVLATVQIKRVWCIRFLAALNACDADYCNRWSHMSVSLSVCLSCGYKQPHPCLSPTQDPFFPYQCVWVLAHQQQCIPSSGLPTCASRQSSA